MYPTAALAVAAHRIVEAVSVFLIDFAIGSLAMTVWEWLTHRTPSTGGSS